MGKKDASQNRGTPVEQYRKSIGKQHVKVGKKDLQAVKAAKEAKSSAMGVKEVVMVMTMFSITVGAIYLFLYVYLSRDQAP